MATSIFLARLIGPVMALVGVGVLANEAAFRKMAQEFLRSPALIFFGWAAVINGAVRVLVPDRATKLGKKLLGYNFTMAAAAFWLVVGAALCYFGFRSGVNA
jgi:hypothetical protein